MSETGALDDRTIRDIAKRLILAPGEMEDDKLYQRIKNLAPADFKAIQNQVFQILVVEQCTALGGISRLGDESYEWMLKRVDGLSFTIKKHILQHGLKTKSAALIALALEQLSEVELSQHTSSIENLMHEVIKGDFTSDIKNHAHSLRDRANEASPLSLVHWQDAANKKG